jgi:hypothetical protein
MAARTGTPLPSLEIRMKHLIVASLALALSVPALAATTHAKTTATHHKAHSTTSKHHVAKKKTSTHHKAAKATARHKHA